MTNSLSISIHGFLLGVLPLMAQVSPNVWRLKASPHGRGKKGDTQRFGDSDSADEWEKPSTHPIQFPTHIHWVQKGLGNRHAA